jgi:hypothetical protein
MRCEWRGAGGGLGVRVLADVRRVVGSSGVTAGSGIEGVDGAAVDSLLALGKCILSPLS